MKTIRQIEIEPVFCDGDLPEIPSTYEEGKMYISKNIDYIGFNCFCGCGCFTVLPVNQTQTGWQLKVDDKKRITLEGSVLQYSCKAHYIITKNKVNFV